MIVRLLAASALGVTVGVVGGPAVAEDHRPCVSKVEFQSVAGLNAHYDNAANRAEVEERWEVKGRGRLRSITGIGNAYIYPRCGYRRVEAFYAAGFDEDGQLWVAVDWRRPNATLHGHP